MEDGKTQLEIVLKALLEKDQKRSNESFLAFVDNLHPFIKLAAPMIGAFLWLQSNFATNRQYLDQDHKITETNLRLDAQIKDVKLLIDQRYQESVSHSNDNRDRLMAVMSEIKDNLKTLFLDRQIKH